MAGDQDGGRVRGSPLPPLSGLGDLGHLALLNVIEHPFDLGQVLSPEDAGADGLNGQIVMKSLPLVFLSAFGAARQAVALIEHRHLASPRAGGDELPGPDPQVTDVGDGIERETIRKDARGRMECHHSWTLLFPLSDLVGITLNQSTRHGEQDDIAVGRRPLAQRGDGQQAPGAPASLGNEVPLPARRPEVASSQEIPSRSLRGLSDRGHICARTAEGFLQAGQIGSPPGVGGQDPA